jgi:NADH dehydrogenase FAD-containing subunit
MITQHPALMLPLLLLLLSNYFESLEANSAFRAPLIKAKATRQTSTPTTPAYSRTIKTWLKKDGMPPLADVDDATTAETADATAALVDGGGGATAMSHARIARVIKPRPYGLFLAEKGALLFLDPIFGSSTTSSASFSSSSSSSVAPPLLHKTKKESIIVLGTGWGAASFLKNINTDKYDVTVISPRNYFVFTPMLAGASVGTVDYKSITQPIREINNNVRYIEATATNIDTSNRDVACTSIACEGNSCETVEFALKYDKLVFAVGAKTSTFGTPGVEEYCNYLKQIADAQQIKNAIVNCFDNAGLPTCITDEDKVKELTFVIIGAGPTGIEFCAELLDFIEDEGPRYYRDLLPFVRIKIVEAAPTILRPFEDGMRQEAIRKLTRSIPIEGITEPIQPCEILLNKQVSEVTAQYIYFKDGSKIQYGMSLWAAGIGQLPITKNIIESLTTTTTTTDNITEVGGGGGGGEQSKAQDEFARGRVGVDPWLRVLGGHGHIFSLGDCSCVSHAPTLPATAQVASQQGEYLGKLLSNDYTIDAMSSSSSSDMGAVSLLPPMINDHQLVSRRSKLPSEQIAAYTMSEANIAPPFQFLDLGILAYTGSGSALAQVQVAPSREGRGDETWDPVRLQIKGKVGFALWRTIYLAKQTSTKNVILVTLDWIKVKLFGRDISIL